MATDTGRNRSRATGRKSTGDHHRTGNTTAGKQKIPRQNIPRQKTEQEREITKEISVILLFVGCALLFLCNFGIIGPVGDAVSGFLFGIFGITAYAAPAAAFLAVTFGISNRGNFAAMVKLTAGIVLFFTVGAIFHLVQGDLKEMSSYSLSAFYELGKVAHKGGGILAGSLAYLLFSLLDIIGAVGILLALLIICLVLITEKSFLRGMKKSSQAVYSTARQDAAWRREKARIRKEEEKSKRQTQLLQEEEEALQQQEAKEHEETEKILRMDKKVSGVMLNTSLKEYDRKEEARQEDIHEITLEDLEDFSVKREEHLVRSAGDFDFENIRIHSAHQIQTEDRMDQEPPFDSGYTTNEETDQRSAVEAQDITEIQPKEVPPVPREYVFPPLSCLKKSGKKSGADGTPELKETAMRLQQTLQTFGVRVTITDISQGPAVTRYELQPEQGVKVSKVVGLADDIKLNLAATDIRIEAPIPGKAAIGIEVPNKENASVGLRELLETKEYRDFPSRLAFAVGKDIAGKTVVADIARMPHMLIAGATGSGKSVCINTLIMSILYKAHPDEVKLIMIDPKVVELSVYNGIPHLLIPVVTDPKKAAGALHWGVAEMTDRYQKFADFNVRDLKGYNEEVVRRQEQGEGQELVKLPQIVIIVDELADLMMVAPGEVEESICRLAQLARACGIHLIIATQRPSVDVITGLIKANMPSRVAFAVSSGVDSRTILDMNGAEKLLGKGDMLFYPQGYPKPARIQGAFVSDQEVGKVVDFLKSQSTGTTYHGEVEEKIMHMGSMGSGNGGDAGEKDSYFVEAGKFIIEKDKASIGMLQRVFKIGFNRAARIMDQLAEAGVVGDEEGTKPRKILMSMEAFEAYIENYL